MISVCGTAIDLGTFFVIPAGEKQCDSSRKLGLAHLFRNFHVGGVELAVAIGFEGSKDITDNLFLPIDQLEGLSGPGAFGMTEGFDKSYCVVGGGLVINRICRLKPCRSVFLQLSDIDRLLPGKIKDRRWQSIEIYLYEIQPYAGRNLGYLISVG